MCLFKLLTVASCLLQTGQLVAPVWIFAWFLREPGVVKTLRYTMLLFRRRASPFHIGHKESAEGLLKLDSNPGTSFFHNIPLRLKQAFLIRSENDAFPKVMQRDKDCAGK